MPAPKITFQTTIHIITVRLVNGRIAPKQDIVKDGVNVVHDFNAAAFNETIICTGAKTHTNRKEADKYHEQLEDALILLGR